MSDNNFNLKLETLLKRVEKPARYIGNELNVVEKDRDEVAINFAFAFPDLYEIGMSYMGMQILYNILNKNENIFCERVFAPAPDMEKLMREEKLDLFSLESKTPLKEFDFIGFTLQYEMSFTNVLNMLNLANIPIRASERDDSFPIIMAGGPCCFNPEPLAEFIDVFLIGDGEILLPEICELKEKYPQKSEFLEKAVRCDGVYVPSFYSSVYGEEGKIEKYEILNKAAPKKIKKALIANIDDIEFPKKTLVPLIGIVHDRAVVETFRGCTRGCRFCQAGMIYRPVRERKSDTIIDIAKEQLKQTGHQELSLLSLSTSDYSEFQPTILELMDFCKNREVSLSLPSLRLDNFSFDVLNEIQKYRKTGLTFAPEAGTQRLRDVINKNITEKDILDAVRQAITLGWKQIKLYFMIGLPTETYADLDGIVEIAKKIVAINREENSTNASRFNVTISVSNFVPKPHTPFQWDAQNKDEEFKLKHDYLKKKLSIKNVTFKYHDSPTSVLEAVMARGDRKLCRVIEKAFEKGCKFDAWEESFNSELWEEAFEESGIDKDFYATRTRKYEEVFPWDIIDSSVTKDFYKREREKALKGEVTADCRMGCVGCGINSRTQCELEGILRGKEIDWKGY